MSSTSQCADDVIALSARDGLLPNPALHAHLPPQCLWQPAHHCRPGDEQAHADRHQLLLVVTGVQRPHDGHFLHAFYPHPQHPGGLHLRGCNVQDHLVLYGWGHWFTSSWCFWVFCQGSILALFLLCGVFSRVSKWPLLINRSTFDLQTIKRETVKIFQQVDKFAGRDWCTEKSENGDICFKSLSL